MRFSKATSENEAYLPASAQAAVLRNDKPLRYIGQHKTQQLAPVSDRLSAPERAGRAALASRSNRASSWPQHILPGPARGKQIAVISP